MPRRKPLPASTAVYLTPPEAAALDRLLDAYLRTEVADPGLTDLKAVYRKIVCISQDHTAYVAPTRAPEEAPDA